MEASGMGQGTGGDGGQQGDGQQGGEQGQGGPDLAALQGTLAQHGETLESMREFMQELRQAQGQETDPQQEQQADLDLDLSYLDPAVAAGMDPDALSQQLQQTISQAADQIADRKVNERIGPVEQQMNEMRRSQEVTALVGEFPELGEADTAQQVLSAAASLAQQMGRPELGEEPSFWRLTYLAGRAADAAQEEQGDVPAPASLESGAGATPGGGGGELGDLIVSGGMSGRQGAGVLPFGPGQR
jgi:hypothetical protein